MILALSIYYLPFQLTDNIGNKTALRDRLARHNKSARRRIAFLPALIIFMPPSGDECCLLSPGALGPGISEW